ncbi:MAG: bacterial regulatory helix-turn-helix, lysR family protein [Herbaspirillum sp.]|jgi:DNA-binding transcriptional LysR family regulator|nr:bacterial regulatory helix-turn-helix, lysR family protein [Herbaspirillum sp.]
MKGLDLRQLRYFSILARELHFRKAADLAFVSQPALSQQISKLEETMGVVLLTRDRRNVQLTPAGIVLRDELDKTFDQLQRAIRLTREAAHAREFRISIGLVEYTNLPFVPPALIRLQQTYPALKVQRHEMNSAQQAESLPRGAIDVGFGVPVSLMSTAGIVATKPVLTMPWTLLMRTDHRLAALRDIRVEDLAGERLIMFERSVNPALYDCVTESCQRAGFTPNFVYETQQSQVGISLVNQGMGVMLGAAYVFSIAPADLVMRRMIDMQPLALHMYTREGESDPLILEYMDIAQEEARRTQLALDARLSASLEFRA